jgi:hypothetical protein
MMTAIAVAGRPRTQRTMVWFVPEEVPLRAKFSSWRPGRRKVASFPLRRGVDVNALPSERSWLTHPRVQSAESRQVRPSLLAQTRVS